MDFIDVVAREGHVGFLEVRHDIQEEVVLDFVQLFPEKELEYLAADLIRVLLKQVVRSQHVHYDL